jgi:hypothetical protein
MFKAGIKSLSAITLSLKQIAARPVRYYLNDRASNTLITYGAIKIVVLVGAIVVVLAATKFHFLNTFPVFPSSLTKWDGGWYISIARSWYAEFYPEAAVFPPLYPLLIKVFSLNQPSAMPWVAIIISNVFSFIALYFLYRLVPLIMDERYRLQVCFAFMVFPVLLVCTLVAYSEAVFLAFTIGAYYYWKRSKLGLAALFAICAVFTRQVGVFIFIIFVVDMLYEYWAKRDTKRVLAQLAAVGATIAGIGALFLFYYVRFGNPFIVSQVYSSYWGQNFTLQHVLNNLLFSLIGVDIQPPLYPPSPYSVIPSPAPLVITGALALIATAICLYKRNTGLALYSLLSLLLFLSGATRVSYLRYIAATFPIYLFFGLMLSDHWKKNIIIGIVAIVIAIENLFIWMSGSWLY